MLRIQCKYNYRNINNTKFIKKNYWDTFLLMYFFQPFIEQYMTDGVLLRETLKDADLDKYRYVF